MDHSERVQGKNGGSKELFVVRDRSEPQSMTFCKSEYYLKTFYLIREEIDFMLSCCDTNHDGKIDYIEFTDRFHNPAKEIGFNLAVLLTNLSEHMPSDPR